MIHLRGLKALVCMGIFLGSCTVFATSSKSKLPADVTRFIAQRENCDHFRGEEAYDEARAKELKAAFKKYCKGTDQKLKKLRSKYKRDSQATNALKGFEDRVE